MQTQIATTLARYAWSWQDQTIHVTYETCGQGQPLLILPAFSTVSTRAELDHLTQQLSSHFSVTTLDWPGFGESDRGPIDYGPQLYSQFLRDFVSQRYDQPIAIIAAGHSAGYALTLTQLCSKLALIAPTWKGPLTAMGLPSTVRNAVKGLIDSPGVGQALYGLNTQPSFLKLMYQRHVMVDDSKLTVDYLATRHAVTQAKGARFAPAAFVTGNLDPCQSREEFLAQVKAFQAPIMVVVAEQAPPKSKAEMNAIAALPNVTNISYSGSLGMAEEFGRELGPIIQAFFNALS